MARRKSTESPQPPSQPRRRPPAGGAKTDKAFDVWLDRGLRDLFGSVTKEPIPDDLLKLLNDDKTKE